MSSNSHLNPAPALKAVQSHCVMNSTDGIYNYNYSLSHAKKLLNDSVSINQGDKELFVDLVEHLASCGVSKGRLAKYIYHLKNCLDSA
ncbi:MAG: hypothetical protein QXT39_00865 [Conexivisphaerales archaeon]